MVAVTRAGVARLDFDDLVGQDGDVLHLMVSDTALERLNARRLEGTHAAVPPEAGTAPAPACGADGTERREPS